jgi:hypothetical protein
MKRPASVEEVNRVADPRMGELNYILDQLKDYARIRAVAEVLAVKKTLFDFTLILCCLGSFFISFSLFHAIAGNYSHALSALGPASASLVGGLGFYARIRRLRGGRALEVHGA